MERKTRGARDRRKSLSLLERVNRNAAGIDCGSAEHYVAVPPDRDAMHVRKFRTFTADLHGLAEWLVACGITTVAMEATGVFWIPIYDILQERGLEVLLVNARHFRNVALPQERRLRCGVATGVAQRRPSPRKLPPCRRDHDA